MRYVKFCCVLAFVGAVCPWAQSATAKKRQTVLIETSDFQRALFFKPKLVSAKKWRPVFEEFQKNYRVTLGLLERDQNKSTLCLDLAAKAASDATFVTVEGGLLVLVPKEAKPDQANPEIALFREGKEVFGASFPGFKDVVKSVLSHAAPKGVPEAAEMMFRAAGVGKYDTRLEGTLFERAPHHVPVGVNWHEIRVDGRWAKPTRIQMRILLDVSLEEAQTRLENQGVSIAVAVRTSISTQRLFFIVDRLGCVQGAQNDPIRIQTKLISVGSRFKGRAVRLVREAVKGQDLYEADLPLERKRILEDRFIEIYSALSRLSCVDELAYAIENKDPWGRPYFFRTMYERRSLLDETPYVVVLSSGRDRTQGTEDDIYMLFRFREEDARTQLDVMKKQLSRMGATPCVLESGERAQALRAAHQKRLDDARQIATLLARGQAKIEAQSYANARQDLEAVLKLGQGQDLPGEQVQQAVRKARELLAGDAVKFGSMGWVLYEGEWMPPARREERIRLAQAEVMRAQGLVDYLGRWVTPEERDGLTEEARIRRERAVSLANQERSVREQIRQGADLVVLDSAEGRLRWFAESWANPVEVKIEERELEGAKFIVASLNKGAKDRWVLTMRQPCDLSDYDELKVDFDSPSRLRVAIGVWTLPEYALHESRTVWVETGRQEGVSFDLLGKGFKSKASTWIHSTAIENPDKTYMISLFFYSPSKQPVAFTNVRLAKKRDGEGGEE